MERYYKKSYSRFAVKPLVLCNDVPLDYAPRLRCLRRELSLTQAQLATKIGAGREGGGLSVGISETNAIARAVEANRRLRMAQARHL
jgi:hypothetical protein